MALSHLIMNTLIILLNNALIKMKQLNLVKTKIVLMNKK